MRRNSTAWDILPEEGRALLRAQTPEATDPGCRFPIWWQLAYACFCEASSERQLGFGIGPIPSSAIYAFAARKRLSRGDADDLHGIVRRMDAKYLELEAARAKEGRPHA